MGGYWDVRLGFNAWPAKNLVPNYRDSMQNAGIKMRIAGAQQASDNKLAVTRDRVTNISPVSQNGDKTGLARSILNNRCNRAAAKALHARTKEQQCVNIADHSGPPKRRLHSYGPAL
jgi:hypothetical protein